MVDAHAWMQQDQDFSCRLVFALVLAWQVSTLHMRRGRVLTRIADLLEAWCLDLASQQCSKASTIHDLNDLEALPPAGAIQLLLVCYHASDAG
jgi:hypothetical protein